MTGRTGVLSRVAERADVAVARRAGFRVAGRPGFRVAERVGGAAA
ncbi:hypothetical protein ACIBTV_10920 [Micromonospora sp. NPDC049366]